jgi:hypothetical protein
MWRISLPALLLATLLLAPAAWAQDSKIIRDCALDGVLNGNYTTAELRSARAHLPTDVDEYSDCRDVLSRAIAAATQSTGSPGGGSGGFPGGSPGSGGGAGGGGGGGAGGVSAPAAPVTPSTPADHAALAQAGQEGGRPIEVDGRPIVPGSASLVNAAGRNALPSSTLIVLVLLGAATLASIAPFLRRHVRARSPR